MSETPILPSNDRKPERLGMKKLAVVFAILLFLVQLVLAMFGVQSFWLGVVFEVSIATLLVYWLWVWEGTHGIGTLKKVLSGLAIVTFIAAVFWYPARNQYRREHPIPQPVPEPLTALAMHCDIDYLPIAVPPHGKVLILLLNDEPQMLMQGNSQDRVFHWPSKQQAITK